MGNFRGTCHGQNLLFVILTTLLLFAGCAGTTETGTDSLGVLRSTDGGTTWTPLGQVHMANSSVWPVDPTGFTIDGHIVLYFVDFGHLNQPVPQSLYRATSTDGVNFDTPRPVYTQPPTMVDPFVLPMPGGLFRAYIPSEQEGIISAVSNDGLTFTRENGIRITFGQGGMPAALLLPDNRVRLFVNGSNGGQDGIFSLISGDGLDFTVESGMRVPAPAGFIVNDAQPIRVSDASYLMLYQMLDLTRADQPEPWTYTEVRLATSADALTWTVDPRVIGYGGTSCIVQTADGTLFIYYVNR
jgi:hypothetical protein